MEQSIAQKASLDLKQLKKNHLILDCFRDRQLQSISMKPSLP